MMRPETWEAMSRLVEPWIAAWPDAFPIAGSGTKSAWLPPSAMPGLRLPDWDPVLEHDADDQVAVVWAGASIASIQAELAKRGQSLLIPSTGHPLLDGVPGTLGGMLAMNLPTALPGLLTGAKDWTLGLAVAMADGTLAKSGAKVVKSVAGYDVHKLMVGGRGMYGVILAAAVRVSPLSALPNPVAEARRDWTGGPVWIQRTLRSDFAEASQAGTVMALDPSSQTLWHDAPPIRHVQDWVIAPHSNLEPPEGLAPLWVRAREVFDPTRRLNPHLGP